MESVEDFCFPKFSKKKNLSLQHTGFLPYFKLMNSKEKGVDKPACAHSGISGASKSLFPPPKSHFIYEKKTMQNSSVVSPYLMISVTLTAVIIATSCNST